MTIGELDRRVEIEYPSTTTNNYGETTIVEWVAWRAVWAKVDWRGGSEGDVVGKITATTKVDFYIRNLDLSQFINSTYAPTMKHRIKFAPETTDKYYYLDALEEIDGREAFIKLITEEKD